jgi:hypothetical protein
MGDDDRECFVPCLLQRNAKSFLLVTEITFCLASCHRLGDLLQLAKFPAVSSILSLAHTSHRADNQTIAHNASGSSLPFFDSDLDPR